MIRWDTPRTPSSTLLLSRLAAERGVPLEVCLRGTHITPADLTGLDAEVTAGDELAVIGNLLAALGDPPGLGLDAGVRYHLTAYGIWGFALISSPTLRSAIDVGLRYLDLTFAFCRIRAREAPTSMQLVLDAPGVPRELTRFVVERDAAAIQTIRRELSMPPIFDRVEFAFPEPADGPGRYVEVFGVTPVFDAPETVLTADLAVVDRPLPQADAHTAALARAQCQELLARRRARTGLAGEVRDLLLDRPADPPDADRVAAALHLSGRTLRHRLAAEGTSFRALLDEVRERLAEELLVAGGLPVAEVARRLGYAEVSSFSQAFRRWKGMSPRAFRDRRR
ncbi:AraC family transcriptional regulator [Rhodococcus daqingensis]|uniref:AraC family transcriptional regulator n=1 Tax=Rhodococcus daqingensis TaxID=2479363 RepID=A0ABW2S5C2_9NOCA